MTESLSLFYFQENRDCKAIENHVQRSEPSLLGIQQINQCNKKSTRRY